MIGTKKGAIKRPLVKISEHEIQSSFVQWFRLQHPEYVIFAIPNGTRCSIGTARKMVKEGALAGVPDIFIAAPTNKAYGLFLEFKTPTGKLSEKQKEIGARLVYRGYAVVTVRSFDDAVSVWEYYLRGLDEA